MTETIILGDNPYGVLDKRTWKTILRARLWLLYWDIRMWLAERGLFVPKVREDK